jgi:F-type H+-transporting ATPase subunit a
MNPMEQFAIKPLVEAPLFQIGGARPIYFTNQA